MGLGLMNKKIIIQRAASKIDSEGFNRPTFEDLKEVRVFVEEKHLSERWANSSVFKEAELLFKLRSIHDLKVTSDLFIFYEGNRYNILSVENIKGRGMYLEILAKKVTDNG